MDDKERTPEAPEEPHRIPQIGANEGLPPIHTLPYEIEQNVRRIAAELAEGRDPEYD